MRLSPFEIRRKLKHTEVKKLTQGHSHSRAWSLHLEQGSMASHSQFLNIATQPFIIFFLPYSPCVLFKLCNRSTLHHREMYLLHFNFIRRVCYLSILVFFLSYVRYWEREKQSLMAGSWPDPQVRPWWSFVKHKQFHKSPSDKDMLWKWGFRTQDHSITMSKHRQNIIDQAMKLKQKQKQKPTSISIFANVTTAASLTDKV